MTSSDSLHQHRNVQLVKNIPITFLISDLNTFTHICNWAEKLIRTLILSHTRRRQNTVFIIPLPKNFSFII
uniref:Uncharacterized protein n=1 Tax=Anguilla anguilla TaxID=7936 RepID=A0A0E9S595_ANGAN